MRMNESGLPPWDIQAARNLYNIQSWGAKYSDINEAGHVVARPLQEAGAGVYVNDAIEEAKGRLRGGVPRSGFSKNLWEAAAQKRHSRCTLTRAYLMASDPSGCHRHPLRPILEARVE